MENVWPMKRLKRREGTQTFPLLHLTILLIGILLFMMGIYWFQKTREGLPSFAPPPTYPTASWKAHAQAWIYPGPPACYAASEYKDGRGIDTLKPQYYSLSPSGILIQLTTA